MFSTKEIRNLAIQRLRELFPRASAWQESSGVRVGEQTVDLLVKFKMGPIRPQPLPSRSRRSVILASSGPSPPGLVTFAENVKISIRLRWHHM